MEINEILKILPHRYPFIMIDRVIELSSKKIVAIKNVTINENYFAGHFPEYPIMPGVLMIEALAQAGGIYASQFYKGNTLKDYMLFLMGVDKVKFRKSVVPGMTLKLIVEPIKRKNDVWRMKGKAVNEEEILICEAEFMAMMSKASK
jgi:3-hydroxyacyl-[acyl-carrier-protein] dehydratase